MVKKRIVILGSTGSVGRRALDVVRNWPDRLEVVGLSSGGNSKALVAQAEEFGVSYCALAQSSLPEGIPSGVEMFTGPRATVELVESVEADCVLVATVGISGLLPTLAAIRPGVDIALANKEVLVVGGFLVMAKARAHGVRILAVDSEHNALAQCLKGHEPKEIRRLILTASGGPFRQTDLKTMEKVTPEMALRHPTWSMGAKITIDSATLMNKGFEVIEAMHLFQMSLDQIDVLIHPTSLVHSLVEFVDGSMLAQLGPADMYLPIQNCLLGDERATAPVSFLDLAVQEPLKFELPDGERFPCLGLAYDAARRGGLATTVLNGANEVAVERFLGGHIQFLQIPQIIGEALDHLLPKGPVTERDCTVDLEQILGADARSREFALDWSQRHGIPTAAASVNVT
jgi:1-deoxy-D-xylulose-5-phosphate reductoisomerase